MIPIPAGTRIWVACGPTDMRRGFDGLAMLAQEVVKENPHSGHLFVFRGKRRADRIKILWWDGTGLCLYAKRLERGRFVWPVTSDGAVRLTPAQLSMLIEGLEWRTPVRPDAPRLAG
jgi:transposase